MQQDRESSGEWAAFFLIELGIFQTHQSTENKTGGMQQDRESSGEWAAFFGLWHPGSSVPHLPHGLPQMLWFQRLPALSRVFQILESFLNNLPSKHFGNASHGNHHIVTNGGARDCLHHLFDCSLG